MVIAECLRCGKRFYGWSEKEATEKYYEHYKEHKNGALDPVLESLIKGKG